MTPVRSVPIPNSHLAWVLLSGAWSEPRDGVQKKNTLEGACVIIGGKTWPRDRPWVILVLLATAAAVVWYAMDWTETGRIPGGSSRSGFVYGIIGGLIIVFELLLWPRKRVRSWRLGSAQTWLRAHVWLGLLALPLVVMHARLLLVGGLLNVALMVLFLLVIASGIWGLVLQQFLPRMLLEEVPAETIREQIDQVAARECLDMERLLRAVCEPLDDAGAVEDDGDDEDDFAVVTGFRSMTGIQGRVLETLPVYTVIPGTREITRRFHDDIKPFLVVGRASQSSLAGRRSSEAFFASLRSTSPAAAGDVIAKLERACEHRRQFDLQARLHDWLHAWLLVHVPLSVALGVLLAVHVPVALWYW